MKDLPASHPLYGSEQSKSGFGICYQFAIKCPVSALRPQCFQGFAGFVSYSHSIVPTGFGVKKNIIAALIDEYDIETADDIQAALKDLLGGTIKSMMEAEMDEYLGYGSYERSEGREPGDNYRNGTKKKNIRSSYGEFQVDVPQDRNSTFEPQIVKKHQKDISEIDQKIISMYARGLTTRQISEQIEEIYGFECSEGFISDVTDKILQLM